MAEAQIRIVENDSKVTIIGDGVLDLTNSQEFKNCLKAAAETADNVVMDLRPAQFIDTAIVQYIANAAVCMMNRGKRLRVVVADGSYPHRVMKIVAFDQLMDVAVESARTEQVISRLAAYGPGLSSLWRPGRA